MQQAPRSVQPHDPDAHWVRNMVVLAILGMTVTLVLAATGVSIADLMR